jgi:hypothetical protein
MAKTQAARRSPPALWKTTGWYLVQPRNLANPASLEPVALALLAAT